MRILMNFIMALSIIALISLMAPWRISAGASDSDLSGRDSKCEGILVDGYCEPNSIPGVVNLEDHELANKLENNGDGRLIIVKEKEMP